MCPSSSGLVKSDPMNTTKGRVPHNYSTFKDSLSYKKHMLLRYADYVPSFEMEGVENDEISVNTKDFIDSLSLNSPFKGTIRKIKESFKVPYMAMLPMNWDQIYTQPSVGNDVPIDANTIFTNFPTDFSLFWKNLIDVCYNNIPSTYTAAVMGPFYTALLRALVVGEYVYSKGSLLNFCGYKASAQFEHLYSQVSKGTYDQFFDLVLIAAFRNIKYFKLSDSVIGVVKYYKGLHSQPIAINQQDDQRYYGSFRSALDAMRENPNLSLSFDAASFDNTASYATDMQDVGFLIDSTNIRFILPPANSAIPDVAEGAELNPNVLNYSRLIAYQLVYFHFYTNSSLDPVYSAELYRQYVHSLLIRVYNSSQTTFTQNGVVRYFDFLSGRSIANTSFWNTGTNTPYYYTYAILSSVFDPNNANTRDLFRLSILAAVFATRHSLRYGDYFVGSRPRPLAPINTDVGVNNNAVSVIDITQKQWSQKFANAVMRSRQKVENYVEMLFGKKPEVDFHNPLFLSRETDVVYGDEVQNTGALQAADANSRTSNIRGGLGQFTFTFHNDDMHPCVYMQIISFDIKRAYTRSVDRQFLHADRYDMFNPNFQYIGDQPIYGIEIGYVQAPAVLSPSMPLVFGYTSRDMEYKQRFDVVCGGFEDNLPGWILTDIDRDKNHFGVLDADFIRNENSELDRFYLSLTGFSLGTYFHFICITQNNVFAKRSMAVDPQILG